MQRVLFLVEVRHPGASARATKLRPKYLSACLVQCNFSRFRRVADHVQNRLGKLRASRGRRGQLPAMRLFVLPKQLLRTGGHCRDTCTQAMQSSRECTQARRDSTLSNRYQAHGARRARAAVGCRRQSADLIVNRLRRRTVATHQCVQHITNTHHIIYPLCLPWALALAAALSSRSHLRPGVVRQAAEVCTVCRCTAVVCQVYRRCMPGVLDCCQVTWTYLREENLRLRIGTEDPALWCTTNSDSLI